jgi:hypothetical protein
VLQGGRPGGGEPDLGICTEGSSPVRPGGGEVLNGRGKDDGSSDKRSQAVKNGS